MKKEDKKRPGSFVNKDGGKQKKKKKEKRQFYNNYFQKYTHTHTHTELQNCTYLMYVRLAPNFS